MRLTDYQIKMIREVFNQYFMKGDKLWLFGSRVDPLKKGGDIDLYVETQYDDFSSAALKKTSFLTDLKMKIGDQKIDVVLNCIKQNNPQPIYLEAKKTGIQLI